MKHILIGKKIMNPNENESFFMYLPSNVIYEILTPGQYRRSPPKDDTIQTPSNYKIHCPKMLKLGYDWEVALCEAYIPNFVHNLKGDNAVVHIVHKDKLHRVKLPDGQYDAYNYSKSLNQIIEKLSPPVKSRLYYNSASKKYTAKLGPGDKIIWTSDTMKEIIGLGKNEAENTSLTGHDQIEFSHSVDFFSSLRWLYVYTDIVEYSLVGDVFAPILRILDFSPTQDNRTVIYYAPQDLQYHPINLPNISAVHIRICDGTGEHIHFGRGNVLLVLHFRKKKD